MRLTSLAGAGAAHFVTTVTSLLIIQRIDRGNPELALVFGAILGTWVGAFMHWRSPGRVATAGDKLKIGLALSLSALIGGILLQLVFGCFKYPDVSVGVAVVFSPLFPFGLWGTIWKALPAKAGQSESEEEQQGKEPGRK